MVGKELFNMIQSNEMLKFYSPGSKLRKL